MPGTDADKIIERYVSCFSKFDDMTALGRMEPVEAELPSETPDEYGRLHWKPLKIETAVTDLQPIYAQLPAHFPPLYETLVLSYRWAEVDLKTYRLVANPLSAGLERLLNQMTGDTGLTEMLLPAGYIQFAKGPDVDYDPVCFDLNSKKKAGEFATVKIDHEEILCNYRLKVVAKLAASFEELIQDTIDRAVLIK
jgi:hypothetical protein